MTSADVIDIHVHLAGVGAGGSGCYFHPRRLRSLAFRLIRRHFGLTAKQAATNLDELMRERLAGYLRARPELRVVVLALDWARDAQGEILKDLTDVYVPNDYVLQLARENPAILAGVSIHPCRPDALAELRRTAAAGAALVKWLPVSQNFSPADDCCRPFFAEMVRLKLPLLCHTGSEGATRNINKAWNDPRLLRPALEAGVTVIAAHCGMRSGPHDRDYLDDWAAMLRDYPRLYGDTAAWFGLRARRALRALARELVVERLVYGSDWPIPNSPWWFLGAIPLARIRELAAISNPLQRDLETKRALGLPEEVFTRGQTLIRANLLR